MGEPEGELVGATVAQYRIEALIGRGGMGEVYRARDTKLDRIVAVKCLRTDRDFPQRPAELIREAQKACRVSHPHLAAVHDVVSHAGRPLIVMEHVRGSKLSDLTGADALPPDKLFVVACQITEALGAIHRAGLVHRDLKPSNIMIADGNNAKVLDFGLATSIAPVLEQIPDTTVSCLTLSEAYNARAGTVPYMSPEQLQGRRLDQRSDLFSLGIILYECVTGSHPFNNSSMAAVASSILNDPPRKTTRRPRHPLAAGLHRVSLRLLAKAPEERYATAAELGVALQAIRTSPWTPSRRAALFAIASPLLVALAAFALWRPWEPPATIIVTPGRPALAILPLDDHTGEDASRAAMVAGLIEARLSVAPEVRPVARHRVIEVQAAAARLSHGRMLRKIASGVSALWLLEGAVFRDDGFVGTFELHNVNDGSTIPLSVTAATGTELAARAALRVRELIGGGPVVPEETYLASGSDEAQESYERARQAVRDLDFAQARTLLDAALARDPDFVGAHLLLSDVLFRMGYQRRARDSADAAWSIVRAKGLPADSRTSRLAEGLHARMSNRTGDSIAAYERLLERYPEDVEAATALAQAYSRKGETARAIELYDRALQYDRLDPWLHLARADLLVTARRFDEATQAIDESERILRTFSIKGGGGAVEDGRGYVAFRQQDWTTALAAWQRAADSYEADGLTVRALDPRKAAADVQLQNWELDPALRTLDAILPAALEAGHLDLVARTLGSLGAAHYRARQFTEAEAVLERAIENARQLERPELEHSALISLSGATIDANRVEAAHAAILRALELSRELSDDVREAHALLKLAHWYRITGDIAAVRATLEPLLPESAAERVGAALRLSAWQALAEAEIQFEFPARALDASAEAVRLAEALASDPRTGFTLCLEVRALATVGEIDEARRLLARAESLLGDQRPGTALDTNLRLAKAAVDAAAGDFESVLQATGGLAPQHETTELIVTRAHGLVRAGRPEEALSALALGGNAPSIPAVLGPNAEWIRAASLDLLGRGPDAATAAARGATLSSKTSQALSRAELCDIVGAVAVGHPGSWADDARASLAEYLDRVPSAHRQWVIDNRISAGLRSTSGNPVTGRGGKS